MSTGGTGADGVRGSGTSARSKDGSIHVTDERVNTVSHLIGSCFALAGAALLIAQAGAQGDPWKVVGFSVYGFALVLLFVASTLHHGLDRSEVANDVLRTLDYTSVFALIAGTVTPLVLVLMRTTFGWTMFGVVWAIAALGIVMRSVWRALPKYVTNTLYISLGWVTVLLVAGDVALPLGALVLMAAGGVAYTVGFVIFVLERPNPVPGVFGFHELWHVIVILAAALHYLLMYLYVLPA